MLSADRLREKWRERACSGAFAPMMTFEENGLVLGAGTVLVKRRDDARKRAELALDGSEERLLALFSVAYDRAIDARVLGNIRRASIAWRDGETVLALIHLAHAGLPPLADDEAAYRLFAADRLLASGIDASPLLTACDIDTTALDLMRAGFNPDEPRVPAGNSGGGQWTDGDSPVGDPGTGSSRTLHDLPTGADDAGPQQHSTRAPRTISGVASWYDLPGKRMANGRLFDPNAMAAAMRTVPLGSTVVVQSVRKSPHSVRVVVTDRGPYVPGRVIGLTPAAFRAFSDD